MGRLVKVDPNIRHNWIKIQITPKMFMNATDIEDFCCNLCHGRWAYEYSDIYLKNPVDVFMFRLKFGC